VDIKLPGYGDKKPRMKKNTIIISYVIIIIVIIITVLSSRVGVFSGEKRQSRYFVRRVVDGDTILLANNQRVRYIGIDTPEKDSPYTKAEWMWEEAEIFNRKLVESKWVTLEFDFELRDKYDRLLAYVYIDDTFVNAEIIKAGLAKVLFIPPNMKYADIFTEYEAEAKREKRGIWGAR